MRTLLGMFLALMLSIHGTVGCAAALASTVAPPDHCASMETMQADRGDEQTPVDKASHECQRLCYLVGVAVTEPGLAVRLAFPATPPSAGPAARHAYAAMPATPPPRPA